MVRGLDLFRDRFREFEGSFILIGGAACDEWLGSEGLVFRATKDLDIVLIIEALHRAFVEAFRRFVAEGSYEIRQRTQGTPVLYRFTKPKDERFPFMLELFSRKPEGFNLEEGQEIVPLKAGIDHHSLSAILFDEDYYALIQTHSSVRDGIRFADATALIPLKACAWLDLSKRKAEGADINSKDIAKHRNDVFRLAGTLPDEAGPELPEPIKADIARFLDTFPENHAEWDSILAAIKGTLGGQIKPATLRSAIKTFFRLPE
jgi:hypothetical protein